MASVVLVSTEVPFDGICLGGIASSFDDLAFELSQLGHDITHIVISGRAGQDARQELGYVTRFIARRQTPTRNGLQGVYESLGRSALDQLVAIFPRKQPDLILGCANRGLLRAIVEADIVPCVIRLSSDPIAWRQAAGPHDLNEDVRSLFEYQTARRAQKVISPSEFVAKLCLANGGVGADVVRTGFSRRLANWYVHRNMAPRFGKTILHVGGLEYHKGADLFIDVMNELADVGTDFNVALCGHRGSLIELQAVAPHCKQSLDHLRRSRSVTMIPAIARRMLFQLMSSAMVVVFSSRVDNLPITLTEAAIGRALIVAPKGASFDEVLSHDDNCCHFDLGDSNSLARAIRKVLRATDCRRDQMRHNLYEMARSKLDPDLYVDAICKHVPILSQT